MESIKTGRTGSPPKSAGAILAARAVLGLTGLLLAGLVLRDGIANWAVETRPSFALSLAPYQARVLAAAADDALANSRTGDDLQRASDLASRALAADITQVSALRDLGLIAARRGDWAKAARLMSLAGRRSPLDGATHLWLMSHRLTSGDDAGALDDADVLLRHKPELTPALTPVLIAYADQARAALTGRLAANPPWRTGFIIALAAQARDPAVVQTILSDLAETPAKPTPEEWAAYFARRVKDQAYELAYLDWLRTLPPTALAQAKSVYDGDFRGMPGAPPFNWQLGEGPGGAADLQGAELHARYDGYGAPELAQQLLVLAPGSYRFSGQARTDGDAAGALAWTIFCADASGVVLARIPAPDGPGAWLAFSAPIRVPETGCTAQWLRLTVSPTDHVRPVEIWYRGLAIDQK